MKRVASVLALVAIALVLPALADDEAGRFFCDRGVRALEAGDFKGAKKHFERSISEGGESLAARAGLARAEQGLGRTAPAKRHAAACLRQIGRPKLTAEDRAAIESAAGVLDTIDALHLEYLRILGGLRKDLFALALEYRESDPDVARLSLERLLLADPDCSAARQLLGEIGGSPVAPGRLVEALTKRKLELISGKDLASFGTSGGEDWYVRNGLVVGAKRDGTTTLVAEQSIAGDYVADVELRVAEDYEGKSRHGLIFGRADHRSRYAVVVTAKAFEVLAFAEEEETSLARAAVPEDLDVRTWHTCRLTVTRGTIRLDANGKNVLEHTVDADSALPGGIGLLTAFRSIEVRRFTITQNRE